MQEKSNKGLIWLIVILIILVIGLMGFILFKEFYVDNNTNSNTNNANATSATNTTTIKKVVDNSKYDEVTSFNLTFNNKEHEIDYKFDILEGKENHKDLTEEEINDAKQNGDYVYRSVNLNIFVDEVFVKTIPVFFDIEGDNDYSKLKNTIKSFDKESIKILQGTDKKEYLVFLIQEEHPFLDGKTNPIIVNETGKILYKFDYQLGGSKWIEDPNSKLYCKTNSVGELSCPFTGEREYLIDKDKIYFINTSDSCPEAEESEYGYIFYFQESILTINNDKVNIENGNCYKGNGAGAE